MLEQETRQTGWDRISSAKPYAFALLIAIGLVLEIGIHWYLRISIDYTQFYYLFIVLAGLWYERKALWIAAFFGFLQICVSYLILGQIVPETVMRAVMFCVVGFVVGEMSVQMNRYRKQLELKVKEQRETNALLRQSTLAFETANKKLNLLSSITRHDILNQLTSLRGYLDLTKSMTDDPKLLDYMERQDQAAQSIERQISFARLYQNIGVHAPRWQKIAKGIQRMASQLQLGQINLSVDLGEIEVYADPLLEKICYNLMENSLRHGKTVKNIRFSWKKAEGGINILYDDDGIGVPQHAKELIFTRDYVKHTGMGLFLAREILSITGLTLKETGTPGKGVRFEIYVPDEYYRFGGGTEV